MIRSSRGTTLVELTVAFVLTSIVISIVYFTWNHLTIHTHTQKRRSVLNAECLRITQQISIHLHQAEQVLDWSRNSIRVLRPTDNDTISYSYDGTTLQFNKNPLTILSPQTTVQTFTIENSNPEDPASPYLFTITLKLQNAAGDTTSRKTTISLHRSPVDAAVQQEFWK